MNISIPNCLNRVEISICQHDSVPLIVLLVPVSFSLHLDRKENYFRKMKFFKIFELIFSVVAIRPGTTLPDSNIIFGLIKLIQTRIFHHAIFIVHVSCYVFSLPSLMLYIFVEAKTFKDYFECLYPFVTTIANLSNIIVLFCNRTKIFDLIDHFESTIETRKAKTNSQFFC